MITVHTRSLCALLYIRVLDVNCKLSIAEIAMSAPLTRQVNDQRRGSLVTHQRHSRHLDIGDTGVYDRDKDHHTHSYNKVILRFGCLYVCGGTVCHDLELYYDIHPNTLCPNFLWLFFDKFGVLHVPFTQQLPTDLLINQPAFWNFLLNALAKCLECYLAKKRNTYITYYSAGFASL